MSKITAPIFKESGIGTVPNEWTSKRLIDVSDIQTGPFGSQLHEKDYVLNGTPIITVEHLSDDRINHEGFIPQVSDEDTIRLSKRYALQEGDVVFSRVGSVDRSAYVSSQESGWLFSGRLLRVRPHAGVVDPRWLDLWLRQESVKEFVRNIAVGATMPSINTALLGQIPVAYPELFEQKKIADVLSVLDDKIELNRTMNANLEKFANTLFKKWFVHIGNELPEGWRVSTIGEECQTYLGGTPSRERDEYWTNGTVSWVNSGKVNEFRITQASEYITEDAIRNSAAKILPKGTVVIAITGATLGQYSLLEIDSSFNQSVVGIGEGADLKKEYIYFWIANTIRELINSQTGGAQQHINKRVVDSHKILVPDQHTLERYYKIANPVFCLISKNCFETESLTSVRGSLLSRLMSGKIRINA